MPVTVCVCVCVCVCVYTQSCPVFCYPMDCSPPGSSVHEMFWQEYWSGLPFPTSGDLPDQGIESTSSAFAGASAFTTAPPGKPLC